MCSAGVPIQIRRLKAARRRQTPPLPTSARGFPPPSSSPMMTPSMPASVIGPDLAIVGQKITLVCKSTLMVTGEVSGDIHGDDVTVGETGKVTGTVTRAHALHPRRDQWRAARRDRRALCDGAHQRRHRAEEPGDRRRRPVRRPRAQSPRTPSEWQPVLDADAHRTRRRRKRDDSANFKPTILSRPVMRSSSRALREGLASPRAGCRRLRRRRPTRAQRVVFGCDAVAVERLEEPAHAPRAPALRLLRRFLALAGAHEPRRRADR